MELRLTVEEQKYSNDYIFGISGLFARSKM